MTQNEARFQKLNQSKKKCVLGVKPRVIRYADHENRGLEPA